jgi:hypothetical protein
LRSNPLKAAAYSDLKARITSGVAVSWDEYMDAKDPFVAETEKARFGLVSLECSAWLVLLSAGSERQDFLRGCDNRSRELSMPGDGRG